VGDTEATDGDGVGLTGAKGGGQVEPRGLSLHFAGNIIEAAGFEALPQVQHVGEIAGCHESSGLETALH
jgi:hypothetical protein